MRIEELLKIGLCIIVCALFAGAIIYFLLTRTRKYNSASFSKPQRITHYFFISYVIALLLVLFLPLNDSFYTANNFIPGNSVFLILYNRNFGGLVSVLLNVCIFIPLGFIVPSIISKFNMLWKVILLSLGLSFVFETIQLLIGRAFDIDDILCNTAGGIIGFCIFSLITYFGNRKKSEPKYIIHAGNVIASSILTVFIVAAICFGINFFNTQGYGRVHIIYIGKMLNCEIQYPQYECFTTVPIYLLPNHTELMNKLQIQFGLKEPASIDSLGNTYRTAINCKSEKSDDKIQLIVDITNNRWIADINLANAWDISSQDKVTMSANNLIKQYGFSDIVIDEILFDSSTTVTVFCSSKTIQTGNMILYYDVTDAPHVSINSTVLDYIEGNKVHILSAEDTLEKPYICSITYNDSGPATEFDMPIKTYDEIIFDTVELSYIPDTQSEQLIPVWKYSGIAYSDLETSPIFIIAPAMV